MPSGKLICHGQQAGILTDFLLTKKLGKTKSWVKNTMVSALGMARDSGLAAAVGLEDATRTEEIRPLANYVATQMS